MPRRKKDSFPEPVGFNVEYLQYPTPTQPVTQSAGKRETKKLPTTLPSPWLLGGIAIVAVAAISALTHQSTEDTSHESGQQINPAALAEVCINSEPSPIKTVITGVKEEVIIMGATRRAVIEKGATVSVLVACGANLSLQVMDGASVDTVVMDGAGGTLLVEGTVDNVYLRGAGSPERKLAVGKNGQINHHEVFAQ